MKREPAPPSMQPAARGRRVRARLAVIGWTQKQLAEQIGTSQANLTKMLDGKPEIDPITAWRIARVIGLTARYILFGERDGLPNELFSTLPPED